MNLAMKQDLLRYWVLLLLSDSDVLIKAPTFLFLLVVLVLVSFLCLSLRVLSLFPMFTSKTRTSKIQTVSH